MVAIERGYYDAPFKGLWGVTQRVPLSSNLFNVILEMVVRHWMIILVEGSAVPEVFNCTVHPISAFFYTNDRLLVLNQPECLQWEFYILVGIFELLGLNMNVKNMGIMVFQLFHVTSKHLDAAYMQQVTG